jgi:NTP pyrophosphatase (non-canonical NTP hydrolase)
MTINELEVSIFSWAKNRGIFTGSTPIKQALKTQEEVTELLNAIVDKDEAEIKDAIGDIVVTLIIQCHMNGLLLKECIESAYDVINKRKGKMVNGQFVKDE